jgi:hypothetical protein
MNQIQEPILYDEILGNIIPFKDLVIKDIKNECSDIESDILSSNVELWLYNVRIIRRDVEFQLSSNKSKNKLKALEMREDGFSQLDVEEFITKQNKWRINTIKFLTSIERKMLYVKMLYINQESN